ncbi:MAG: hypothetical protein Q4E50_06105 [Tissierellia bacterium]|nr:hypothetical protein [Tissierellia bacterium]
MKKISYISFMLFICLVLVSCNKEENEGQKQVSNKLETSPMEEKIDKNIKEDDSSEKSGADFKTPEEKKDEGKIEEKGTEDDDRLPEAEKIEKEVMSEVIDLDLVLIREDGKVFQLDHDGLVPILYKKNDERLLAAVKYDTKKIGYLVRYYASTASAAQIFESLEWSEKLEDDSIESYRKIAEEFLKDYKD